MQQVLDTLVSLDKAFATFGAPLSSAVTQINARADQIVASLERIRREADSTASKLGSIGKVSKPTGGGGVTASSIVPDVSKPIEKADQATRSWMLSWQTFSRVIQTQVLIRGFNAIRDAVEESYQSNLKFSKSISEIHAIDPGRSFAQTAASVRELSDAFNQPLSDVAESQYQAISSQFVKAADQARLLSAANALAKTTAQELSTATLLIAGSLNAYGESSDTRRNGLRLLRRRPDLAKRARRARPRRSLLSVPMRDPEVAQPKKKVVKKRFGIQVWSRSRGKWVSEGWYATVKGRDAALADLEKKLTTLKKYLLDRHGPQAEVRLRKVKR